MVRCTSYHSSKLWQTTKLCRVILIYHLWTNVEGNNTGSSKPYAYGLRYLFQSVHWTRKLNIFIRKLFLIWVLECNSHEAKFTRMITRNRNSSSSVRVRLYMAMTWNVHICAYVHICLSSGVFLSSLVLGPILVWPLVKNYSVHFTLGYVYVHIATYT